MKSTNCFDDDDEDGLVAIAWDAGPGVVIDKDEVATVAAGQQMSGLLTNRRHSMCRLGRLKCM